MNKMWIAILAAVLSVGLLAADANAKRLGGGSSIGAQRSITPPAARPPVSQQTPAATPPAAPAPQPSGMSRFLGPLAGLALGAGLASMFMGGGMGGAFGSILMMLALAAAVMFVFRMLRPKPQAAPLQFAGAGGGAMPGAQADLSSGFGGGAPAAAAAPEPEANRFPPGFDAAQFAYHAKLNFTKLQTANDNADLSAMRDLMTPAMYTEIEAGIKARGQAPQKTDVVTLNAEVIEVVTEGKVYIASINFSGMIREDGDAAAAPFSEIWHLEKPVDGSVGWLISGIQQN